MTVPNGQHEQRTVPPDKWLFYRNVAVTALVVAAFLALDFFTPTLAGPGEELIAFWIVGMGIAQLNLIAVWAALAPGNVILRLPWSILLSVLMWYSLVLGNRVRDGHFFFSLSDALFLGAILMLGVVATQLPMWIAGRVFRWRLTSPGNRNGTAERNGGQFGLGQLLLGMLLLALALAPVRMVLPAEGAGFRGPDLLQFAVVLLIVAACNLFITVPCVWGAFLRLHFVLVGGVGWLVYCAFLSACETGVFFIVVVMSVGAAWASWIEFGELFLLVFTLNASQCATVLGTLLIFRALGFRLLRGTEAMRQSPADGKLPSQPSREVKDDATRRVDVTELSSDATVTRPEA